MSRAKKKVLGLLGLFLVVAVTTVAFLMPDLGATAKSGLDITHSDEVTVRVVGEKPVVHLSGIESGSTTTSPNLNLRVDYENVGKMHVEVEYTDNNGQVHTYVVVDEFDTGGEVGSKDVLLRLKDDPRFGYGHYKVKARAKLGEVGYVAEDALEFTYVPFAPNISGGNSSNSGSSGEEGSKPGSSPDNPFTGNLVVDPGIDPNDDTVGRLEVCVRDAAGNPVEGMCPMVIEPPFGTFELPFEDHVWKDGQYSIEIKAYDKDGNLLGEPQVTKLYYKASPMAAPNTGAMFEGVNISREDGALTGLIVFGLAAALGVVFVLKKRKAPARRRRR